MDLKILVVDDEPGIVDSVTQILMGMDSEFKIHKCETAQEAMGHLDKGPIDIVITDIKMPGMSGLELLARVKKMREATQVVVMSGHGDLDAVMQCLKNNAADFLAKPFDIQELRLAVKRCILNTSKWESEDQEVLRLASIQEQTVNILDQAFQIMQEVYVYAKLLRKSASPKVGKELDRSLSSMDGLFEQIFTLKSGKAPSKKKLKKTG